MTQTETESPTERFIHAAYEEARAMREWLERLENVEYANALALALLDTAVDLWSLRLGWEEPAYQHFARAWWREHAALPFTQTNAIHNALRENGMHEPSLHWS